MHSQGINIGILQAKRSIHFVMHINAISSQQLTMVRQAMKQNFRSKLRQLLQFSLQNRRRGNAKAGTRRLRQAATDFSIKAANSFVGSQRQSQANNYPYLGKHIQ